jgi:hypothetical protein
MPDIAAQAGALHDRDYEPGNQKARKPNRRYPGEQKVQKPKFWSIQLHCEEIYRYQILHVSGYPQNGRIHKKKL